MPPIIPIGGICNDSPGRLIMGRLLKFAELLLARITYAALFLMMALITIDAIGRYLIRFTLLDVFHFTELYLMPLAVFFAMPYTQSHRGHVNVTLLSQFFPPRLDAALQGMIFLGTAVICALITYSAWLPAWSHLVKWRVTGGVIPWPTGISRIIVPIGMGVLCLRLIVDGIVEIRCSLTGGHFHPSAEETTTTR
jgi:TRAP-type C4-dicarboxylate transport system permease small subunit